MPRSFKIVKLSASFFWLLEKKRERNHIHIIYYRIKKSIFNLHVMLTEKKYINRSATFHVCDQIFSLHKKIENHMHI